MSCNNNLVVSADKNGKIDDLFKISPENIIGDNTLPVSPQYEKYIFSKLSLMGSGELAGIYYDSSKEDGQARGNNLGCRGFYVHGWELVSITFVNPQKSNDTITLINTETDKALDNYLYNNCKFYNKVEDTILSENDGEILKQLLQNSYICKIDTNGEFDKRLTYTNTADIAEISPGIKDAGSNQYIRYLCLVMKKVNDIDIPYLTTLFTYPDYTKSGTTYKYSSIKLKLHVRDRQISGFTSYSDNNNPKINCSSNYEITHDNVKYRAANVPSLLKFKIFSDDLDLSFTTKVSNKLKTQLQNINNNISSYKNYKYSYTSNYHNTDIFNLIDVDSVNGTITVESNKVLNLLSLFANDPGVLTINSEYALRTYDTALYTYDDLDFGLCEIYPTCFAVGTNNTAAGDGSIATGMGSKAMGAFSTAFGRSSQARGYTTFAAGHRSKALIEKSVALGDACETRGTESFAAGYQCIANSTYSVAMGRKNITNGDISIAIGNECTTNATNSISLGTQNTTNGNHSFAAGYQCIANSSYSVAIGDCCNVNAVRSFAMGRKNITNGNYSVAIGDECTTNATNSISLGTQNTTNGNHSFAAGYQCIANSYRGEYSVAMGRKNITNGNYSVAIGDECTTNATNSISLGTQNTTNGNYSVALGTNIITSTTNSTTNKSNQVIVGSYNCENKTARFAVGGGTIINTKVVGKDGNTYTEIIRKNIFEVVEDGKIIVPVFDDKLNPIEDKYCWFVFQQLDRNSTTLTIKYSIANTGPETNKRYKKVWRNNSTGVETTTDPTL